MTDPTSPPPPAPRPRKVLPGIAPVPWEPSADRAALQTLRSVPGFDEVVKKVVGFLGERGIRLLFRATAVRGGSSQSPRLNALYTDVLTTMDWEPRPELFISQTPFVNAGAYGMERPFIVINSGALKLLDDDEMRALLGHEVGHVMSGHALYHTLLVLILNVSLGFLPFLAGIALLPIQLALLEWFRKSELSSDRAGLLASQDPSASLRMFLKMAGGGDMAEMDLNTFLVQAKEYEETGGALDRVFKILNTLGASHPFNTLRAAELQRWIEAGHYERVLGGEYTRRRPDRGESRLHRAPSRARLHRAPRRAARRQGLGPRRRQGRRDLCDAGRGGGNRPGDARGRPAGRRGPRDRDRAVPGGRGALRPRPHGRGAGPDSTSGAGSQALGRGRHGAQHGWDGRLLPGEPRDRGADRAGAPRGAGAHTARDGGPGDAVPGGALRRSDDRGRRNALRARVQLPLRRPRGAGPPPGAAPGRARGSARGHRDGRVAARAADTRPPAPGPGHGAPRPARPRSARGGRRDRAARGAARRRARVPCGHLPRPGRHPAGARRPRARRDRARRHGGGGGGPGRGAVRAHLLPGEDLAAGHRVAGVAACRSCLRSRRLSERSGRGSRATRSCAPGSRRPTCCAASRSPGCCAPSPGTPSRK